MQTPAPESHGVNSGIGYRPGTPLVLWITRGVRVGRMVPIDKDRFTIGSGAGCDAAFPEYRRLGVAKLAGRVRREAEAWVVRPSSGQRLFVNDEPVIEHAALHAGDVVRVGHDGPEFQFIVQHANQRSLRQIAEDYAPHLLDTNDEPGLRLVTDPAAEASSSRMPALPGPTAIAGQSAGFADFAKRRLPIMVLGVAVAGLLGLAAAALLNGAATTPPAPAPQDAGP
ncbi:MAG: FHA domain-containing protein [Planctomycetota bacterium]